jgi:hypothetical protein
MFFAATMCSCLAAIFCWVAVWSTGPFRVTAAIGPIVMMATDSSDIVARILFGAIALMTVLLSGLGWVRWWRALCGLPVDLS